jgi:dATP pyrophosphohydrolase
MSLKRPESVLVVIYDQHHRVLVMQRDDDAEFWQSVTGTIEVHEQPIETAYREVAEETGLILEPRYHTIQNCRHINQFVIREQWLYRYPEGTKFNFEHVFCVQVDSQLPITLTEHTDYVWLTKAAAVDKVWSKTNAQAIAKFVPEQAGEI